MKKAEFWDKKEDGNIQCCLCPHYCIISDGRTGRCGVRKNTKGTLYALNYGCVSSIALDPIEKKPLYHFHPNKHILSVGTVGCNFKCDFCQNWNISQDTHCPTQTILPSELVEKAKTSKSFGIAYTYNEPFIWYEYVFDCSRLAQKNKIKNVLVTNGFVNQEPLRHIIGYIDAMNIDIKSMSDEFYKKMCKASLKPVLETAKFASKKCHVEITNLIVTGLNDSAADFENLTDWIYDNLGPNTPLHLSRYFPCFKCERLATPIKTMNIAFSIAKKKLKNVYLGNI